jgi:hypothetical protein
MSRPILPGLRVLFQVAGGLVILATIQLFILSESTDRFFAWHIALPLTAAIDGAFYLASSILLFSARRARSWIEVRPLAWGVLAISALKLLATLLHVGSFHFDHGVGTARVAAWGWLIVYALVPVALGTLIAIQARTQGEDPPVRASQPASFRWFAGILAIVLLGVGFVLLVLPGQTADRWPWPLTDLTAQDLAAWFAGIGVLAGLSVARGDRSSFPTVWLGSIALAVLQGVALLRYRGSFDAGSLAGALYLSLLAVMLGAGIWGWRLRLRVGPGSAEAT